MKGIFCLLVELHREGSTPAARSRLVLVMFETNLSNVLAEIYPRNEIDRRNQFQEIK